MRLAMSKIGCELMDVSWVHYNDENDCEDDYDYEKKNDHEAAEQRLGDGQPVWMIGECLSVTHNEPSLFHADAMMKCN
jgi:hypothetical protein